MASNRILKINAADNIAVALQNLSEGDSFLMGNQSISLKTNVNAKHKFALKNFDIGDEIIMYGNLMGKATQPILRGSVITTQNVKHDAHGFTTKTKDYTWTPPDVSRFKNRTFDGFHRADGQVGTQNVWLIIPLVFCENRNVTVIHEALTKELGYAKVNDFQQLVQELKNENHIEILNYQSVTKNLGAKKRHFPNIDGIKVLTHQGGCGGIRQDSETLCGLLAGYVNHPNVGGATILSLGCQNAEVTTFKRELEKRNPNFDKPLVIVDQQKSGTEKQLIDEAIIETFKGLHKANQIERTPAPLSKLNIGVKCGGSDRQRDPPCWVFRGDQDPGRHLRQTVPAFHDPAPRRRHPDV